MTKNLNLITQLDFDSEKEIEKSYNDFDGRYYRLNRELNKKVAINYSEEFLESSATDFITIEFLVRFNLYRTHTCLTLLDIKNSEGNFNIQLLVFDDDYYFIKVTNKHIEEIPEDENEIFESNRLCKSLISDGKWHKISLAISSQNYKVWLDCDLILNAKNPIRGNRDNLQFFKVNYPQEYSVGRCNKKIIALDIKQIILTNKLVDVNCDILSDLNSDVPSTINFIKKLDSQFKITENNSVYFQMNDYVTGDIKIPQILTKPNQITSILFECTFRHRGPINNEMVLLAMHDCFEDNAHIFAIDSGKTLIWKENFQYFRKFNKAQAKLDGKNVYDGDWHDVKIEIRPGMKEAEYDDPLPIKKVKFWVDDKFVSEDTVSGLIMIHGVLQKYTMFDNYEGDGFKNFDVKKMKLYVNED